jgi:hypothetical protein
MDIQMETVRRQIPSSAKYEISTTSMEEETNERHHDENLGKKKEGCNSKKRVFWSHVHMNDFVLVFTLIYFCQTCYT